MIRQETMIGFPPAGLWRYTRGMNPGDLLDGRYQIVARLGAGGMGEVYEATHVLLGSRRVIKIVHPNIAGSEDAQDRFLREARIATRVQHSNVATLHDFAALPNGAHYMVWELIEGENLAQRLRTTGTLSPRQAIAIALQALRGLEAIHAAGIVHRDISPENLMLTPRNEVKIIDLGVAKLEDPDAVSSTQTGIFVGKLRYAAPEQLGFLPEGEKIDGRADLYALAMVLFELLAGRPPYEAKSPHEYFLHHAREVKQPTIHLPAGFPAGAAFQEVLEKALSRSRNDRFSSAAAFTAALEQLERSLGAEAELPTVAVSHRDLRADYEVTTASMTVPAIGQEAPTLLTARPDAAPTIVTAVPQGEPTVHTSSPTGAAPPVPQLEHTGAVRRSSGVRVALLLVGGVLVIFGGAAFALRPNVTTMLASLGLTSTSSKNATTEAPVPVAAPEGAVDAAEVTELFNPHVPPSTATRLPERETTAVAAEPAAVEPPRVNAQITPPRVDRREERDRPAPAQLDDEPVVRPVRRVAVYVDGPGRNAGNDRALDLLREEMRGVNEIALRAGGFQVDVYRAIKRYLPDLTFSAEADVVIRFDATEERLRRQNAHLAASATIEKGGRVIFRYELPSYVDRSAAAEAFAQTLSDAFVE